MRHGTHSPALPNVLLCAVSALAISCSDPVEPSGPSISDVTIQIQGGRTSLVVNDVARADISPIGLVPGATLTTRWSSSNAAVLNVTGSGSSATLTAVAPGTAEVIVDVSASAPNAVATTLPSRRIALTVLAPPPALQGPLSVVPTSLRLGVGESATVVPQVTRATPSVDLSFFFSSSNAARFIVNETGVVTAITPGLATLSVVAVGRGNGYSESQLTRQIPIEIVPRALDSLIVSPDVQTLAPGRSRALSTRVVGVDAAVARISYAVADPTVASVSASGVVTAIRLGSTNIVVTADAPGAVIGANVTLRRTVVLNVQDGVVSVRINPRNASLRVGGSFTPTVEVIATGNVSRAFQLASSSASVASVSNNGVVTATGVGSAFIRAYSAVDFTVLDSIPITVLGPIRLLKISGDEQEGRDNQMLPQPLVVRAVESDGTTPVANVPILVDVSDNSGSILPASGLTNVNGMIQFTWTQGRRMGVLGSSVERVPSANVRSVLSADTLQFRATVFCGYQSAFTVPLTITGEIGPNSPCLSSGTNPPRQFARRTLLESAPAGIYRVESSALTTPHYMFIGERRGDSFYRARGFTALAVEPGTTQAVTMIWMPATSRLSLEPTRDSSLLPPSGYSTTLTRLSSDIANCSVSGYPTLVGSGSLAQVIASGDCLRDGRSGDEFYVPVDAGERITLSAASAAFTPRVTLYTWNGSAWQLVASNTGSLASPASLTWSNPGGGLVGYARVEALEIGANGAYTLSSLYVQPAAAFGLPAFGEALPSPSLLPPIPPPAQVRRQPQ